MKSLLDPTFKWIPSNETDVRATFERVRREQQERAERESAKVAQIKPKEAKHGS